MAMIVHGNMLIRTRTGSRVFTLADHDIVTLILRVLPCNVRDIGIIAKQIPSRKDPEISLSDVLR